MKVEKLKRINKNLGSEEYMTHALTDDDNRIYGIGFQNIDFSKKYYWSEVRCNPKKQIFLFEKKGMPIENFTERQIEPTLQQSLYNLSLLNLGEVFK